uniref:SH3 and PX domain-containing protein 2A-like n=1 Tax=Phallusia mammillata TaxID=59560 RepID=A0A6F9DSE8_9ASCI|nr:SH3 and PX domain-containing protein 2A-like [Phallusia mammillata]
MNRRKLIDANVTETLKRRYPSKHYVYVIQVNWDDGSNTLIFRRYSKFFDFQISLLEAFPLEGGLKDPSARTIPFLPGKVLFRRSHIREVAMKRLKPIDEYCRALIQLPAHISQSNYVLDFFESKPEDLNPPKEDTTNRKRRKDDSVKHRRIRRTKSLDIGEISGPIALEQYVAVADYMRTQPKELTVESGQYLEVIEKHENGWWFVSDEEGERGWIPGVYLEKRDGTHENLITKEAAPGEGEKYITTAKFVANNPDEISFGLGVLVEVLQKNLEGWWHISYQGKQGWAPASYLDKPADVVLRQSNRNEHGVEIISSVHELKAHRRSLPSGTINAVVPSPSSVPPSLSSSASSSPKRQSVANRRSKEYHSACLNSAAVFLTNPSQLQPPPKRSSVKRGSIVQKPQIPPPLPPTYKLAAHEPVYEYVSKAPFEANIPDGLSFDQNAKIEVIEKSPGGWWYISINGSEGWAPSSYIDKQYKQKSTKPPERPKPPKPACPANELNHTSTSIAPKRPLMKSHSASSTGDVGKVIPAMRPLPPLPGVAKTENKPVKPLNNTKPSTDPGTGNNPSVSDKSIGGAKKTIAVPAVAVAKFGSSKNQPQETRSAAEKDLRKALPNRKPAVGLQSTTPPKRPLKPQISNEVEKIPTTVGVKKQPIKPPAPALGKKKPVVHAKSFGGIQNSVATKASKIGAELNFKSALKPLENNEGIAQPAKRVGNPPPRPSIHNQARLKPDVSKTQKTIPKQPSTKPDESKTVNSVSSLRSKFQNDLKAGVVPAKPKPPISRAKPVPNKPKKPTLPRVTNGRFNNNSNGNNNTETSENTIIVARVESSYITPSGDLPPSLRGSPDGQVDDCIIDEKKDNSCSSTKGGSVTEDSTCLCKYVAMADFAPQDTGELGFCKGAVGMLLEKAKSDWWYMQIEDQSGWVPSGFFEPDSSCSSESNSYEKEDTASRSVNVEDLDTVYSEIDDPGNGLKSTRCVVLCEYEAGEEGTLTVGAGDVLEVIEQTDTCWWFVSVVFSSRNQQGQEGWVPFDHLQVL